MPVRSCILSFFSLLIHGTVLAPEWSCFVFHHVKRLPRKLSEALILLYYLQLLNDSSNTTVNITICIVLNISSDVLFYGMVHFVIIRSISETFQVQNKPMGFLPPS